MLELLPFVLICRTDMVDGNKIIIIFYFIYCVCANYKCCTMPSRCPDLENKVTCILYINTSVCFYLHDFPIIWFWNYCDGVVFFRFQIFNLTDLTIYLMSVLNRFKIWWKSCSESIGTGTGVCDTGPNNQKNTSS